MENASALVKRGFLALEYKEWENANDFFEQALNQNPEDAYAYLGKLMIDLKVSFVEELKNKAIPFNENINYKKTIRFAENELKEKLQGYIAFIKERNTIAYSEGEYNRAKKIMENATTEGEYISAINIFKSVISWKDAKEQISICEEKQKEERAIAEDKAEAERIEKEHQAEIKCKERKRKLKKAGKISAISVSVLICFVILLKLVIIPAQVDKVAEFLIKNGKYEQAFELLHKTNNEKSRKFLTEYSNDIKNHISAGSDCTVALKSDGTVVATEGNPYAFYYATKWTDMVAVSKVSIGDIIGIKADGTAISAIKECEEESEDIVIGSMSPVNEEIEQDEDITDWKDIIEVSSVSRHTVALKSDGTVVATGENEDGQCDVSDWKNIVAVSAGHMYTVGIKSDGTVIATGNNKFGQCDVSDWENIVAISVGIRHTIGIKSDGTVIATGLNYDGEGDVSDWKNIVAISAGSRHTVGLKSDGTVIATGNNKFGQCDVSDWKNIVAISAGSRHTVGLKSDGTVVATGLNNHGQCDVSDWKNIKLKK